MSFHASASNIRVDDGHMLRAVLQNGNGESVEAEYNLNDAIGNNNGRFEWSSSNFSDSATDIQFSIEGDAQVPVLRAQLRDVEGNYHAADVNLAERIGNRDGCFCFE